MARAAACLSRASCCSLRRSVLVRGARPSRSRAGGRAAWPRGALLRGLLKLPANASPLPGRAEGTSENAAVADILCAVA